MNTVSPEEEKKLRIQTLEEAKQNPFPTSHGDYKLIGVHEASEENAALLVKFGPDPDKVGTGSGSGKGKGFYVTPSKALVELPYGECILAVYIKKAALPRTGGSSTVDELEDERFDDRPCYYVMGIGGEIVVPIRCFGLVKLARTQSDLLTW